MGAYIVEYDASLLVSRDLAVTARAVVKAYTFTQHLVGPIDQWLDEWQVVFLEEIGDDAERTAANALAFSLDGDMNDLSDETAKLLDKLCKHDRNDPRWVLYFASDRPGDFKKPLFGTQLARMRDWPATMLVSPDDGLPDLGKRIAAKVVECDAVIAAIAGVDLKIRTFRLTGNRRKLIDDFNALRKSIESEIEQLPLKQPGLKLPTNFLSRVLPPERPAAKPPTAAELKVKLDAAKETVANLEAALEAARQAEAKAIDDAAKVKATADQKKIDDLQADIAKRQAELDKLKGKLPPGDGGGGGTPNG
jgi:hypothetical protein